MEHSQILWRASPSSTTTTKEGDHHIKTVAVHALKNYVSMTYEDDCETDNYYYSMKATELPTPYTHGWLSVSGYGCSTSYGVVIPEGKYSVLTGFTAGFGNGDHHIDEFKICVAEAQNDFGQNVVALYGCMNDKSDDDPFSIQVHYALIPESKIVYYGYTDLQADGGGVDTYKVFANGIPSNAAPILTGFHFNFTKVIQTTTWTELKLI